MTAGAGDAGSWTRTVTKKESGVSSFLVGELERLLSRGGKEESEVMEWCLRCTAHAFGSVNLEDADSDRVAGGEVKG